MNFYKVTKEDEFGIYYGLKCQDDAVLWSGFLSEPDKEKLYSHFVNNILHSDKILIYYLEDNNCIVGYAQASIIDDNEVEFSATNVFKEYQGQGYLQDITMLLFNELRKIGFKRIIGWASEQNKPAEFNLKINRFIKQDEFDVRNLPLLGGNHKFYKWIKEI